MKKVLSIVLLLAMCLSLFAACGEEPAPTQQPTTTQSAAPTQPTANMLDNAADYLYNMYKPASKDEPTKLTNDKDILASVMIDGKTYQITWTVKITEGPAEGVVIGESAAANHVKIDIMNQPEEDLYYTLTATISDEKGNTKSVSFDYFTPKVVKVEIEEDKVIMFYPKDNKYVTAKEYLYTSSSSGKSKYELELTDSKDEAVVMTVRDNGDGSVTFVTDDGKFLFCDGNNVQFVTEEGEATKFFLEAADGGQFIKSNIIAYDKAQYLEVYSGYLTCYGMSASNAAIYTFQLEKVSGTSQSVILDAAYQLGDGESLEGTYTLTGEIVKIDTAWSEDYQNITVTIVCDGDTERPVMCYRLKGNGAKDLVVGDTITVTGKIKNYKGTIEFDTGCNLDKVVKADGSEVKPDEKPEQPDVNVLPEFTAPMANGDKIVIVATAYNMAFSTQPAESNAYYQKGIAVTISGNTVTGYGDTEVWTVIVNDDGTYSFQQGDKTIGMQDSYSSMGLGHPNNKWELIALDNGSFLLKNVVRGNYMEWSTQHGNWTTFSTADAQFVEQLYLTIIVVG